MIWASFPFVGNCLVLKDILVIILSDFLSSSLNSFNKKFGIELGPVAFLALRETITLLNSFSVTGLRRNEVKFWFFK